MALAADASVEPEVKMLIEHNVEKFGSIDYLIHTAGAGIFETV